MKPFTLLMLLFTVTLLGETATELLNAIDDLYRGSSSEGVVQMQIHTEHWERNLTLKFYSEGQEKTLIRILSPKKERGTATLRSGNDLWNWLPKIKRMIKLPSSMLSQPWMGSHFANNDLIKQNRMADDYNSTLQELDGGGYRIDCLPKPDAAVVWGKLIVQLRSDQIPSSIEYFDEDMNPLRTMYFEEDKDLGGRMIPSVLRVVPKEHPEEYTRVTYDSIAFDVKLPDGFFSLRELRQ